MPKTRIINKKTKISPNGSVTGANGILYNDYNAVDDLYNSLAEYFVSGNVTGQSHLASIIKRDFDIIEKSAATSLNHLKDLMSITKEVGDYQESKRQGDKDYMNWLLRKKLLKWQIPVFDDTCKRISLMCGRRAGKSYICAALMLAHCIQGRDNIETTNGIISKPREAMYIGLTISKAADIMWKPLRDLITVCKIPVNRIDNSAYIIYFANSSVIRLAGNSTKAEREKIRGQDCSMFVIDEMQSQSGLLYLLESVILPIVTGRNGSIICAGTAPLTGGTYWEQIQSNDSWSHYTATMKDNDTIPDAEDVLSNVLETNGWTPDNIIFRREYLGEIAHDTNRLVIGSKTYYTPSDKDKYDKAILGIDFGYADNSSWIVIANVKGTDVWDVIFEYVSPRMSSTEIENKTYEALDYTLSKGVPKNEIHIIGDSSHQMFLRDIYMKGWVNVSVPYKLNESQQWTDLAMLMRTGKVRIIKDSRIDIDTDKISWQIDNETGTVIYEIDDKLNHELQVSDATDALKYAVYAINEV